MKSIKYEPIKIRRGPTNIGKYYTQVMGKTKYNDTSRKEIRSQLKQLLKHAGITQMARVTES